MQQTHSCTRALARPFFGRLLLCGLLLLAPTLLAADGPAAAEALVARGERALLAGQFSAAEAAFAEGLRNHPGDARFAYYGGIVAWLDGRPDTAERRLTAAREHHPEADFWLGVALLESENPQGAARALQRYLEARPRDADAELLLGIALAQQGQPNAVNHLNMAARLSPGLRSHALFFRGLSQFDQGQPDDADRALRAVIQLNELPRFVELGEQMIDLIRDRGEVARRQWGEIYLAGGWDDNLTRALDSETRYGGPRSQLRARYWRQAVTDPGLLLGGWADFDLPLTEISRMRTGIGAFADLGFYRALPKLSIDPGTEFDLEFVGGGDDGFVGRQLDVHVRPRLYLFADERRSLKFFTAVGWRADLEDGFRSGLRMDHGLRASWTGLTRRNYISVVAAWFLEAADAAAYNRSGLRAGIDGETTLVGALHLEGALHYRKHFYNQVTPERSEDVIAGQFGIGWRHLEQGWLVLAGTDQELHLYSTPERDWRAGSYWLRFGRYF